MNICLHILSPVRTDLRTIRTATALAQVGLHVTLVDIEHVQTSNEEIDTKFMVMPKEQAIENVQMKHIFFSDRFTRYYEPLHVVPWLLFKGLRMIRASLTLLQTRADVYHASDLTALPACYLAARWYHKPLIFEINDMPLVSPQVLHRRLLHTISVYLLKKMVARCAVVISPSEPIAQKMLDLYKARASRVLRNIPPYQSPIVSQRLRECLGLPSTTRIALYQGSLIHDRGLTLLIRAAAFLDPNIVLVFMGKGESQATLEACIDQQGVEHRVKMLPAVPYADLLSWTASADLGLIIYEAGSPNVPMMLPNKLFEYLMAGVPVLASPLEAVVEIVEKHQVGSIISSLDPQEIAHTINTMLSNQAEMTIMKHNALAIAKNELRWDIEAQQLIRIYEDTLNVCLSNMT